MTIIRICAWCGAHLGNVEAPGPVPWMTTHGICPECERRLDSGHHHEQRG